MKLLISLCNKYSKKKVVINWLIGFWLRVPIPSLNFLIEFDTVNYSAKPISLEDKKIGKIVRGITGLAHYRDGFLALLQSLPAKLVFFSKQYEILEVWKLPLVYDGHSIAVFHEKIYIASTGTDSIIEFDPETGSRVYWNSNNECKDTIHLNTIVNHKGKLFAGAFGKKKGELWISADAGYLMALESKQKVVLPIYHPHSAVSTLDKLYFCESYLGGLGCDDGQRLGVGHGYTRGLVVTDTHIYVGISRYRKKSRSTGKALSQTEEGAFSSKLEILIFRRKGEKLDHLHLEKEFSFDTYGGEIYDIIAI